MVFDTNRRAELEIMPPKESIYLEQTESVYAEQSVDFSEEVKPINGIDSFLTHDTHLIDEARRLTAKSYLRRGFVTADQIDGSGTIAKENDPYADSSDYFVVLSDHGQVAATTRKIRYDAVKNDDEVFPVWKHKDIFDADLVADIEEIGLHNCVEISALSRDSKLSKDGMAPLKLYRALFQDALTRNVEEGSEEEIFLMAVRPALFEQFKTYFDGSVTQLGPEIDYPGEKVIPAYIKTKDGMVNLINQTINDANENAEIHKFVVDFLLDGVNYEDLDDEVIVALEEANMSDTLTNIGFPDDFEKNTEEESPDKSLKELLNGRKAEIIAGAGLIGYSVLRTAGVKYGISPHSDVDWRMFLGIDIATTPSYVMSMGNIIRSIINPEKFEKSKMIGSSAVASSSLLAPYAYIALAGSEQGLPTEAWTGVGAVFALSATSAAARIYKASKLKQETTET